MNILITNDDGIGAPGLAALFKALSPFGTINVAAPSIERSMCSHSVQLRFPIRVDEVEHESMGRVWSVDAFPADCVRLALGCLMDAKPDWVVSGINAGANVGIDVYYSGTVSGAREAAIHGFRAMSISHYFVRDVPIDWERASAMARRVFEKLSALAQPRPAVWNVTFPVGSSAPLPIGAAQPEVVICPISTDPLPLVYRRESNAQPGLFPDAPTRKYFRHAGEYSARPRAARCDVDVLFAGHIAASPMLLNLTDPLGVTGSA